MLREEYAATVKAFILRSTIQFNVMDKLQWTFCHMLQYLPH